MSVPKDVEVTTIKLVSIHGNNTTNNKVNSATCVRSEYSGLKITVIKFNYLRIDTRHLLQNSFYLNVKHSVSPALEL